jgi:hypothetical protein
MGAEEVVEAVARSAVRGAAKGAVEGATGKKKKKKGGHSSTGSESSASSSDDASGSDSDSGNETERRRRRRRRRRHRREHRDPYDTEEDRRDGRAASGSDGGDVDEEDRKLRRRQKRDSERRRRERERDERRRRRKERRKKQREEKKAKKEEEEKKKKGGGCCGGDDSKDQPSEPSSSSSSDTSDVGRNRESAAERRGRLARCKCDKSLPTDVVALREQLLELQAQVSRHAAEMDAVRDAAVRGGIAHELQIVSLGEDNERLRQRVEDAVSGAAVVVGEVGGPSRRREREQEQARRVDELEAEVARCRRELAADSPKASAASSAHGDDNDAERQELRAELAAMTAERDDAVAVAAAATAAAAAPRSISPPPAAAAADDALPKVTELLLSCAPDKRRALCLFAHKHATQVPRSAEIKLASMEFAGDDAAFLALAVCRRNPDVERIQLNRSGVGDGGAALVAVAMQLLLPHGRLSHVDLGANRIGFEGAKRVVLAAEGVSRVSGAAALTVTLSANSSVWHTAAADCDWLEDRVAALQAQHGVTVALPRRTL